MRVQQEKNANTRFLLAVRRKRKIYVAFIVQDIYRPVACEGVVFQLCTWKIL